MVVSLLPNQQSQPQQGSQPRLPHSAGDHRFAVPTVRPLPRPPVVQAPTVW